MLQAGEQDRQSLRPLLRRNQRPQFRAGHFVQWTMPATSRANCMDFEYRYSATANDGRIVQVKDWVNGEEVNHQYDELERLIASATTGPQWGLSWTYDGFGNRLAQNGTKGTAPVVSLSISATTNRITTPGFAYDAAGNLVQWPGGTVTIGAEYDVDGRLSVVTQDGWASVRYYYDARNLRVAGGGSYQVYGLSGELLGEYRPVPNSTVPEMWLERVYFAGRLVATLNNYGWEASNTDRLGSIRAARRYPFGEGNNADNDEFATYRKDTSTQQYYAWHRYYSATWGRFSSPDPYVMSGGLTNPQGWNRYSYVANDPVNYYDPRGLQQDVPTFTVTVYGVAPSIFVHGRGGGGNSEEMEIVWDLPEVSETPDRETSQSGGGFVSRFKDCNRNNSIQEESNLNFLVDNFGAAAKLTDLTAVPTEWILSWAAAESGWGQSNIARSNGNFFGLRKGSNWIDQSLCPGGAVAGWACFVSFETSARSALLSIRTVPLTGMQWTAAGVLTNALINGQSVASAFQQVANLGQDGGNRAYGPNVAGVVESVLHRLECLKNGKHL